MKLKSIVLENFGTYENFVFEFPEGELFIWGVTGGGKSTILEAVQMALYGKTRGASIDSFISRNQSGEFVDHSFFLELIFEQKGITYKITRSKRRKDTSSKFKLERYITDEDGSNGEWYDETVKGKSKNLVEDIIGMNYEQFTMTSLSPQKQSDKFTKASASERRDLIASIRGIDNLATISQVAKEKANQIGLDINLKSQGYVPSEDVENSLKIISDNISIIENNIEIFSNKVSFFENIIEAQKPLQLNKIEKEKLLTEKSNIEGIISLSSDLQVDLEKSTELNKSLEKFGLKDISLEKNNLLNQKKDELSTFSAEKQNKLSKIKNIEDETALNNSKINFAKNNISNNQATIKSLENNYRNILGEDIVDLGLDKSDDISSDVKTINELYTSIRMAINEKSIKELEINKLNKAIQEINSDHSHDEEKVCPTCGQKLSDDSKEVLMKSLENPLKQNKDDFNILEEKIKDFNIKIKVLTKMAINYYKDLIEKDEKQLLIFNNNISKNNEEKQLLSNEVSEIDSNISKIDNKYIPLFLDVENKELEVTSKINLLKSINSKYENDINSFSMKINLSKGELVKINEKMLKLEEEKGVLMLSYQELANKGIKEGFILNTSELSPSNISLLLTDLKNKIQEENLEKGRNLQSKISWENQKEKNLAIKELIKNLESEKNKYLKIMELFSRNGIQKDIVAETKQIIEQYANDALYDFSDGRFTLELSLSKTLKDKDPITKEYREREALEVIIFDRDSNGLPAEYETLSGGESFMIDLSLRIGFYNLIQLVNGEAVSDNDNFLAIDEGFGSLSSNALELVVNTLNKLKRKYGQLIVISHVPKVGTIFENSLYISKDSNGNSQGELKPVTEIISRESE